MDIMYLPADAISCWLPFTSSPFFVEDYFGNHLLYPSVIAQSIQFKLLNQALLRGLLRQLATDQAVANTEKVPSTLSEYLTIDERGITILADVLNYCTDLKEAMLLVLDSVEPATTNFFRKSGETESFLGSAICLEGGGLAGQTGSEQLHFQFADGTKADISVALDTLLWLTAPPATEAIVEYHCKKAQINGERSGSIPVAFGEVGLVIDSRGRPFPVPQNTSTGKERVKQWLATLQSSTGLLGDGQKPSAETKP